MKSRLTPQSETQPASLEKRSEEVLESAERAVEAALSQNPTAQTNAPNSPPPAAGSAPLPRRPKGRLPMVILLTGTILAFLYSTWNSIFRYSAHGDVSATISQTPAPWNGTIQAVYVREGDFVKQGQPIAWMVSRDLQRRVEDLEGQRRLAHAKLVAETSAYWARAVDHYQGQLQQESEYLHMMGEIAELEARINYLKEREARLTRLYNQRAISEEELQLTKQELASLHGKAEKWRGALKRLGEVSDSIMPLETMQHLEPQRISLDNITEEIQRIRSQMQMGEIVSPVTGCVTRRRHFLGDFVKEGDPLVDIVPDGTTEVVVYWPQRSPAPRVGDHVKVQFAPFNENHLCEVRKVAAEHRRAPSHLETRYRAAELLLPVYLKPLTEIDMVPGQEVRVPRRWLPWQD